MGGIEAAIVAQQLTFSITIPKLCRFNKVQTERAIYISGTTQQFQQQICPNHDHQQSKCVTIRINKGMRKLAQNQVTVISNLYVHGCLSSENQNVGKSQKLLINKISRETKQKIFKEKRIKRIPDYKQVSHADYALPITQLSFMQGCYNSQQSPSLVNCSTESQKRINVGDKFIRKVGKMGNKQDSIFLLQNNTQHAEDYFCDRAKLFDLNSESTSWSYFDPLQFLYQNFLDFYDNCVALAHTDIFDQRKCLYLHDTRSSHPVSLLDTNRVPEFNLLTYQPNYLCLAKISNMKIAVQYRTQIRKHSLIMGIDLRKPLLKQILMIDVNYPQYMFVENSADKKYCWILKNYYEGFKYRQTYIDRLQIP